MGCSSFICSGCDEAIWSDSYSGEHVILFLVKDGEVLEWMTGQYNSYGRVLTGEKGPDGHLISFEWQTMSGDEAWNLQHNNDYEDGIAAYHSGCYDRTVPVEVSDMDPDQGWGYQEWDGKGKYRFTTEGEVDQGIKRRPEPRWAQAEEI